MADITTTKRIIELPDASQTITNDDYFAIDNANGDTGKIPASLFTSTSREADQYDPEETYAVGDLCINNNVLYRCTTAITTAEVWTPAHWTQTTLANEISTLNSSLTQKANATDLTSEVSTRTNLISGLVKIYGAGNARYLNVYQPNSNERYGTILVVTSGNITTFSISGSSISRVSGNLSGSYANDTYTIDMGNQYAHWFVILGGSISKSTLSTNN